MRACTRTSPRRVRDRQRRASRASSGTPYLVRARQARIVAGHGCDGLGAAPRSPRRPRRRSPDRTPSARSSGPADAPRVEWAEVAWRPGRAVGASDVPACEATGAGVSKRPPVAETFDATVALARCDVEGHRLESARNPSESILLARPSAGASLTRATARAVVESRSRQRSVAPTVEASEPNDWARRAIGPSVMWLLLAPGCDRRPDPLTTDAGRRPPSSPRRRGERMCCAPEADDVVAGFDLGEPQQAGVDR